MNARTATDTGLSACRLHEIHDCLALALDASEHDRGYTEAEAEARGYVRAALRQTLKLMEVQQ
ncbi:hypothetical protein [Paracoccus aminophilus]|uniref:Uncharacterized protein n=1 Tax=Paracoccus aminophilus JCM 7686 TaxID=1367847 RepID=S5XLN9_PARAH|nr:hypothetical protein [Paracoccus aminophilus]AGT08129.1 hypothetical protein JCM7686_1020 [Paracoccus aminophilus JCM 7686]